MSNTSMSSVGLALSMSSFHFTIWFEEGVTSRWLLLIRHSISFIVNAFEKTSNL